MNDIVSNHRVEPVADTKVGARRDEQGGWPAAREPDELRRQVDENLESLGIDALGLVNLRLGNAEGTQAGSVAEAFESLVVMQEQGLIRHLGVSNATDEQVLEAQSIAPIVCVQNMYNLAHRADDDMIDRLAGENIAYVPFFPLGGFSPLQSAALTAVAIRLDTSPMSVALAWLLRRSPNTLLIPGTSSIAHLRDNIHGAQLELSDEDVAELDQIGRGEPNDGGEAWRASGSVGVGNIAVCRIVVPALTCAHAPGDEPRRSGTACSTQPSS